MPNTVRLHRVLAAPPERVYRAFTEPAAMARWLPPNGFTCEVQQFEPRVGGRFHMSFTQFATGHSHGFGGEFLEMAPGQRLRYTDVFDDPNLPGTLEVTIDFTAVSCGTELHIQQAGIPDAIPPEMCYLGWQDSLDNLKRLVEPGAEGG
ncbi:SRPBCC family protein [Piscinibacterium candidicorallinum]|uniref:SRPBCC family protein n=1 Tax=Piscinibacterium candidicorallinum TaxID=1793872 RepID=A0ABV7GYP2_9BURK